LNPSASVSSIQRSSSSATRVGEPTITGPAPQPQLGRRPPHGQYAVVGRELQRLDRALDAFTLEVLDLVVQAPLGEIHARPSRHQRQRRLGHDALAILGHLVFGFGVGSGLVISPNQTLTLANVPVQRAGSAGGVIQTGQRLGTAAGIALVGSVYFGTLSSSHGDDARAAGHGLRVAVALTAVALVVGVVDVLRTRAADRA
jgi:hypothetical protein